MSYRVDELRQLSDDELIAAHDRAATNVSWGVRDYLDELARRDALAVSEAVRDNTDRVAAELKVLYALTQAAGVRMERLTRLIAILTALAVLAAAAALLVE
jgi:hypothetical protein